MLSKWSVAFICIVRGIIDVVGNSHSADSCLLTLDPVQNMRCAARTTDGRVYSAPALQHWLSLRKEASQPLHVIPSLTIFDVRLCSPRASNMLYAASCDLRKHVVTASAICKSRMKSIKTRMYHPQRVNDAPPSPSSLPRDALNLSSCSPAHRSILSKRSAFQIVSHLRSAYPSSLKRALPARIREGPKA